jgi:bifunctional oligoribonuclease and PAP phosphatase NrnA
MDGLLAVPEHRRAPLQDVREALLGASHVALTTHVNADGDGTGSQAAVAAWLGGHGVRCTLVNPTPFPEPYRFLLPAGVEVADWGGAEAGDALRRADLLLVLDTSEPRRIGPLADAVAAERMLVIDHHPPGPEVVSRRGLLDPVAAATGELVFDLLRLDGEPVPEAALLGIYVALVTDTGSFRYSNTAPRTHLLASHLLERGIDPEAVYQTLFARVPRRRVELLGEALTTLRNEPVPGISWLVVPHDDTIARLEATAEDLDGLVEHARSLEGTEVAQAAGTAAAAPLGRRSDGWGGSAVGASALGPAGSGAAPRRRDLLAEGDYRPSLLVELWVVLLLYGGGRMEDLRLLRGRGIRRLFGWTSIPDPTTFGRFLRRGGVRLAEQLDVLLWQAVRARWAATAVPRSVMLVLDSTVVQRYGLKQAGAEKGYNPTKKGRPSHHPLVEVRVARQALDVVGDEGVGLVPAELARAAPCGGRC